MVVKSLLDLSIYIFFLNIYSYLVNLGTKFAHVQYYILENEKQITLIEFK